MDTVGDEVSSKRMIIWSGHSDIGRFRSSNEDAFIALKVNEEGVFRLGKLGEDSNTNGDYVFAVSDGMGGANAGNFASQIVVDQIALLFPGVFDPQVDGSTVSYKAILSQLLNNMHNAIIDLGRSYSELEGMGSTLSLCWVRKDRIYIGHIGDSRIYHLDASSKLSQLSEDHTHVAWLLSKGDISEYEARIHPARNQLQQVIGCKNQHLKPQFAELPLSGKDRFLICSDGLTEGLFDSAIHRSLKYEAPVFIDEQDNLARNLVDQAVVEDGKDNTTALCFEVTVD
jgi:protein phosphatase